MSMRAGMLIAAIVAITVTRGHGFSVIPGELKQITASTNYFWGVSSNHSIFICNRPCSNWRQIPGALMQVDADDSEVWGVNSAHHIFKWPVDGSGSWTPVGGLLTHVSASGNGFIWGVNKHDHIFRCAKPCSGSWHTNPGLLHQIDGGQDRIYGVNSGGHIFTRLVDRSGDWREIPWGQNLSKMKQVTASGSHEVFGVTTTKDVYRCKKPCLGEWEKMAGHLKQVEAAIHGVYGITCDNDTMGKKFTMIA